MSGQNGNKRIEILLKNQNIRPLSFIWVDLQRFNRYISRLFLIKYPMNRFRYFVENQIFGVCTRSGEMLHISASSIRLYFIYATFLTFGSPIILYLIMAFWIFCWIMVAYVLVFPTVMKMILALLKFMQKKTDKLS